MFTNFFSKVLPDLLLQNLLLKMFGYFKIPLIGYTGAKLLEVSSESVKLVIPYKRRNLNHLNSLYFGALAVGADLVVGYIAFFLAFAEGRPLSFVFKSIKGEFLLRAEEDTVFICKHVRVIKEAAEQTLRDGKRVNLTIPVTAYQKVIRRAFTLNLS